MQFYYTAAQIRIDWGQIPFMLVQLTDSTVNTLTPQLLTKVLPALVLIDVDINFFDCKNSSCEWCLVRVRFRGGTQQFHQQQGVPHHSLYWLDEE